VCRWRDRRNQCGCDGDGRHFNTSSIVAIREGATLDGNIKKHSRDDRLVLALAVTDSRSHATFAATQLAATLTRLLNSHKTASRFLILYHCFEFLGRMCPTRVSCEEIECNAYTASDPIFGILSKASPAEKQSSQITSRRERLCG
jgi:hypothetical protein